MKASIYQWWWGKVDSIDFLSKHSECFNSIFYVLVLNHSIIICRFLIFWGLSCTLQMLIFIILFLVKLQIVIVMLSYFIIFLVSLYLFLYYNRFLMFWSTLNFYILWSNKHYTMLQFLAMAMLADYIPGPKISILEEAFSKNLLGTFLLVRDIAS